MKLGERPRWQLFAVAGLIAFVSHAPSLANGFALDDGFAIVDDERIRDLSNVPGLLTEPYITHVPAERSPYRPITKASYAVSWAMGDGSPLPFHVFNVLAHVAAALLLLSLLLALGASVPASLAGAAIFAAHPVHVEAVASVVGRADVIAALSVLVAARLAIGMGPGLLRAAALAAAYAVGLGSKESAIVLPVLVVLVVVAADALRGSTGEPRVTRAGLVATARGLVPDVAAMAVVAVGYLWIRSAVLGGVVHVDVASYIAVLSPGERFTSAIANTLHVVRLFVAPVDLSVEYGPGLILPSRWTDWRFVLGAILVVSLSVGAVVAASRGKVGLWLTLGFAWFVVAWALVSNLVLPLPMWLAERTLYLPSAGLAIAITGAAMAVEEKNELRTRRVAIAALFAWTAFGVARSATYGMAWANDNVLLSDLVERHPESFRAQWWLGGRMVDGGDVAGGAVWLERAADANPNSALLQLDYVRALLQLNRNAEAEDRVRRIPPSLHPSRSVFMAQALIFQGRREEAVPVVEEGLRHFPTEERLLDQAAELGISR